MYRSIWQYYADSKYVETSIFGIFFFSLVLKMAQGACTSRCRMLIKLDLTRFGLKTIVSAPHNIDVSLITIF